MKEKGKSYKQFIKIVQKITTKNYVKIFVDTKGYTQKNTGIS